VRQRERLFFRGERCRGRLYADLLDDDFEVAVLLVAEELFERTAE